MKGKLKKITKIPLFKKNNELIKILKILLKIKYFTKNYEFVFISNIILTKINRFKAPN